MTRPSRGEEAGAVHHVVAQGNGRRRIVEDDRDRTAFVSRFRRIANELGWHVLASCLMDTHHHAVVETSSPNLGLGMRRLVGGHARWLNARHGREGSVFRQHYWSRRILDDEWLFRACLYVVLNPVAAGLCGHPREWAWCSYASTAHGDPTTYAPGENHLLEMFGATPAEARECYAKVIDDAVALLAARQINNGRAVWASLGDVAVPRGAMRMVSD
jgi:REP element-mobilizing transposase RayT